MRALQNTVGVRRYVVREANHAAKFEVSFSKWGASIAPGVKIDHAVADGMVARVDDDVNFSYSRDRCPIAVSERPIHPGPVVPHA